MSVNHVAGFKAGVIIASINFLSLAIFAWIILPKLADISHIHKEQEVTRALVDTINKQMPTFVQDFQETKELIKTNHKLLRSQGETIDKIAAKVE